MRELHQEQPIAVKELDNVFDADISLGAFSKMAMGGGAQCCLGASLARMQLKVAFTTLFQRYPTLRLAEPAANLEVSTDQLTERLIRVPVTW